MPASTFFLCLERLAEVQVHRLLIVIIEPVAEIQRPQRGIEPQEKTRSVDVTAVELMVVVPRPAAFHRGPQVQREIQRQVRTRREPAVVHRAHQADVLA